MDRLLAGKRFGPTFLRRNDIASLVVEAIRHGEVLRNYELHAFVVMPNHVHLLATALVPIPRLVRMLKNVTAIQANRILGNVGKRFWQEEYYDHWVRDGEEFERIKRYIEANPAKAGLCAEPENFRWSSARSGPIGPPRANTPARRPS